MSGKEFCRPTEEEVAESSRRLPTDGVDGYLNCLGQKQDEWNTIPLNIGVIGCSGVGKSSFINAIRGLTADDEGAAPVGVTETTTEMQCYSHPNYPLLKFWDLPGIGTPNFRQDKYLDRIGFDKFDLFLLLSAMRFTEIDAWLGQEITTKKKKYYFVRTKIACDMENNKRAHLRTHDESKELDKIRRGTRELLESDSTPLFLIDNYKPQKYDFCKLEESLIAYLQYLKVRREEWKAQSLSIGVIGCSGVGKSSFINAIRGLTADDEGAAPVGVTETTTEMQCYSHPNYPLLKFWDLPGVGTPTFPQDKYLKKIELDKFDLFLLLSATRFTENDAWLGQNITANKKNYYYVRTKIACDMENNKKAHPKIHDEEKELEIILTATRKLLENDSTPLFLIDSYEPQKYDFRRLEESLIAYLSKPRAVRTQESFCHIL